MFSGALLLLTDSLCVYPRLFFGEPFRETSFTAGKRPVRPRTFDLRYNRESRHLTPILLLPIEEERRLITNQPDSARFSRISKIPANQQDSPEPARFSQIGQTPSLGFAASESSRHSPTASRHRAISPHSYPQLGTQSCRVICHQGIHRTFSGSWDTIAWAQGHCLLIVVRCPVPFWWVF